VPTDPERWQRIEELIDAVLDLPGAERRAFLAQACPGDEALQAEVLEILAEGEGPAPMLDQSPTEVASALREFTGETRIPLPERVGPYRIERVIGEGGMGTVFLAHRDDGQFDQRVALKLVRRGPHLDARVIRRFRDERQILAALNHPGIARLLDGGIAEDGLPYFAMEHVEGIKITRYCVRGALDVEARLRLFVRVCDALAHAHERQIVHRDVKPSNILVTADGEPRLLDFGIAKLLAADGAAASVTRRSEQFLTPEYASPEQIKGEPVGAASDVYALGVLLYELLTGRRPFRAKERSAHELERAVLEEDPTRPSLAAKRESDRRRLKGDHDAIVLTAMNKEPERRYPGAAALAEDVRRHLAGQPVRARSADPAYLVRRWARRHRGVVLTGIAGAAAAVLVAVAVASVVRGRSAGLVTGAAHRVTLGPELELDPELSPDGRRIAYATERGRRLQILVRPMAGGPPVPVAEALPGSQWHPRWSPDGQRIAFQASGSIYQVPAEGGSPTPLVRSSRANGWVGSPAWSPDGSTIAYVENWTVRARPVGDGPSRLIAERPAAHSLAWSPDGRWIAFASGNPAFASGESPLGTRTNLGNIAPRSLWLVPAAGGTPVQLTDARALNTGPVWLPGSRGLLFVSNRDGSRDVYRLNLDASGRPAGAPMRLTTGLNPHSFSLSARGDRLAYAVFASTANIWAMDLPEQGTVSAADARPFTQGTQVIEGMALSPDGRWLAFDSDRNGNQDVYKAPVAGGETVQLTSDPGDDFVSTWSADGRELALHSYHGDTRRVELVPADGGALRTIGASPPNQRSPGFSPDGRRLVFTSEASGQLELYVAERTDSESWGAPRQLTTRGGWAGRWAPDGHAIAYCRPDGVWLIAPDGGGARQVVDARGIGLPAPELALWSPDSRTIFYKAFDPEGRSSLWSVDAAGGPPRILVRFDDARPSSRPEFATDGRRFYFTVTDRVSDVWTMELK
jgi:Tol biopolymer transport system component